MNQVNLTGRLATDVKRYEYCEGKELASFLFAIDGNRGGKAAFVEIKTFGKIAAVSLKHLAKGRRIAVVGHVTGAYQQDGLMQYATGVVADSVEFFDASGKTEAS